ncbi:glycosyltransferase family 2 protein [Porticoccaceae bacterium]|nr:glycosyltransferase family 2 protein [Porticoccaceae bacterium]
MQVKICTIILSYNEEKHIERAIESALKFSHKILVCDSFSDDRTLTICAKFHKVTVLQHKWINYAKQFAFAQSNVPSDCNYIFRLDADEYVCDELANSISRIDSDVIKGFYVNRHMNFRSKRMRYGGLFPVRVLRLFDKDFGHCENRWMDEHIVLEGPISYLPGELTDDNLNTVSWWINKHNVYSNREAIDIYLSRNGLELETIKVSKDLTQASVKRFLKEKIYNKLPIGLRALLYFIYRYFLRLGFLDGLVGLQFHFLQGLWYRFLVDTKFSELESHIRTHSCALEKAVKELYDIDL